MLKCNEYKKYEYYYLMTDAQVCEVFDPIDEFCNGDDYRYSSDKDRENFLLSNFNIERFTKSEFDLVKSFFSSDFYVSFLSGSVVKESCISISNRRCRYRFTLGNRVDKLKDDWYLFYYEDEDEWYKCDQLDGLEKCIKDKVNI